RPRYVCLRAPERDAGTRQTADAEARLASRLLSHAPPARVRVLGERAHREARGRDVQLPGAIAHWELQRAPDSTGRGGTRPRERERARRHGGGACAREVRQAGSEPVMTMLAPDDGRNTRRRPRTRLAPRARTRVRCFFARREPRRF